MIYPIVIYFPKVRAYTPRPTIKALRRTVRKPPTPLHKNETPQITRVPSLWLKPDKHERQMMRYHAPTPPEPYAECDTPWWDTDPERWIEQPFVEPPMRLSVADWNAWDAREWPAAPEYTAIDSSDRYPRVDGYHAYTATAPVEPAPFVPNTAPLVKAAERKEAELLLKVLPEADCLHVEPPTVATPVVAPNGHKPAPCPDDEHIIYPVIMIDGVPETEEKQARRLASCSTSHGLSQNGRTKFYDGRERQAVPQ